MAGDDQAEEFHRALDLFLQSPTTTKNTKRVILDALKFRPAMAPIRDLLPADEVEERLAMATRVKRHDVATWRAIDVAILVTIPLDQIREARPHTIDRISFEHIERFVRSVLRMRGSRSNDSVPAPSTPRKRKPSTFDSDTCEGTNKDASYTPGREAAAGRQLMNRDNREKMKCIARDGSACIILGTASPEACHIIPFAINSSRKSRDRFKYIHDFAYLWSTADSLDQETLLTDHLACSDKAWNMVALNPQMHNCWSEGLAALKCLGIVPPNRAGEDATIDLQFLWMPRLAEALEVGTKGKGKAADTHWERDIDLKSGEAAEMVREWKKRPRYGVPDVLPNVLPTGDMVTAADAGTCRPLETGRVVNIHLPFEDAVKMKAMIDLQWACIQIASMSGAAGSDDFLWGAHDDDDDDDNVGGITSWLEDRHGAGTGAGTGGTTD